VDGRPGRGAVLMRPARVDFPLLAALASGPLENPVQAEAAAALEELEQLRAVVQPPVDRDGNELAPDGWDGSRPLA